MIFMSQSGLTYACCESGWAEWYREHLRIMRTVDGIDSADRFTTIASDWSPSLTLYSIRSAAVFQDTYYRSIRGMGEWLPVIDMRYFRRNLFEGLMSAPKVSADQLLLVVDCAEPDNAFGSGAFTWLRAVCLYCTTPWRGIPVVAQAHAARWTADTGAAIYRPDPKALQ
jgi:hypothetical protein